LKGLVELKIPRTIVESIELTVYFIPIYLREILAILVARRARHVEDPGFTENLRLGSTVIGEVLARAFRRLETLVLASRARRVGIDVGLSTSASKGSLLPYIPLLLVIVATVVSWLE